MLSLNKRARQSHMLQYPNNPMNPYDLGKRDEVARLTRYDGVFSASVFGHRRSDEVRTGWKNKSVMYGYPNQKSNSRKMNVHPKSKAPRQTLASHDSPSARGNLGYSRHSESLVAFDCTYLKGIRNQICAVLQ